MVYDSRYKKIASIMKLINMGLNIHNMVITNDIDEAMQTVRIMRQFTLRTDSLYKTTDLPFIIQAETIVDNGSSIRSKIEALINEGYMLILADGIRYDQIQDYNGVAKIEKNGDFRLEFSTAKVPLRKMYSHKGVCIAIGNITEGVREAEFYGNINYDRFQIIRDMQDLYTTKIYGTWIEFTKYPIKVGYKHEYYVFWQLREE